jgi:hypothetical protein
MRVRARIRTAVERLQKDEGMYEGADMSNKGLRIRHSLVRISIVLFFLLFFYFGFILIDIDSDLLFLWLKKTIFNRALGRLFSRLGFEGLAALAIGFILRALFSAEEMPLWMSPGADAGSEASVNQEQHQPSRPAGPSAPIQDDGSASTSSVEQPAPAAKPYIALLQLEGERKRLLNEIVDFVALQLEDRGQPQGPIVEQALRLVWYELEIDDSTNQDELQHWSNSLRENPGQYKSIFGFYKPGGIFYEGNTPPGYKTHY